MMKETNDEFKKEFGELLDKGINEFDNPNDNDKEFMKKHPIYFWCVIFTSILLPFLILIGLWTAFVGINATNSSGSNNMIIGIIIVFLYLVGFIGGFFIDLGIIGMLSPFFAKHIPDYPESLDDIYTRKNVNKLILIGLSIYVVCGIIIYFLTKIEFY